MRTCKTKQMKSKALRNKQHRVKKGKYLPIKGVKAKCETQNKQKCKK